MFCANSLKIAVISEEPDPDYVWIRDLIGESYRVSGRPLSWRVFSTACATDQAIGAIDRRSFQLRTFVRMKAARALARTVRNGEVDLIVSHGPWPSAWTETMLGSRRAGVRHLAFAFNFTDLPTGLRKAWMRRAFRKIDHFAVFTEAEKELYQNEFGLHDSKILRAPWGVAPPITEIPPRSIEGPYVAALGGEARDYGLLCKAARLRPDIKFVAVARPHNFDRLDQPGNVEVHFNLPFSEAWGIVAHADLAVVPLRSRETPCGIVTVVGAMHLGKAQIVTEASGIVDYIEDGERGLLTPAGNAHALASAIDRLLADKDLTKRLGDNARAFAGKECSENASVAFFRDYLERQFA